jgi:hypothetical protein
MKTKKKNSNYKKAIDRMNKETSRAIAHVEMLSKLYAELVKEKNKS